MLLQIELKPTIVHNALPKNKILCPKGLIGIQL